MKVIRVEHLSKKYRIGAAQIQYPTLRDMLVSKLRPRKTGPANEIWALKDVSFEVEQGEVVGIIGRNGAGKSTLLKLLAHITRPTEGRITMHGRVGSLLEVGTGFHPELTGRENIYLNGAVLGMHRKEIERKFDEIVGFAEIEQFLDTPVKHYSSGMYMRLAFAVAAHLEPEILLVDEVLAVGDVAFQKKCLGKMGEVAKQGRTVLFVSHNMAAVQNLCNFGVLIHQGKIIKKGDIPDVVKNYLEFIDRSSNDKSSLGVFDLHDHHNSYGARNIVQKLRFLNKAGQPNTIFQMGGVIQIEIEVSGLSEIGDALIGVIIKTNEGLWITSINTGMVIPEMVSPRSYNERVILKIPKILFTPNTYCVGISIARSGTRLDYIDEAARFQVVEADIYGTGYQVSSAYGLFCLEAEWKIISKGDE